jgi:protein-S-isoprenylcysteine O-methyltransferase Ste14
MYLGFVLILLGVAVLSGSATPFAVVIMFPVFVDTVFIRFEETKLGLTFGDDWLDYTAKVRRWI